MLVERIGRGKGHAQLFGALFESRQLRTHLAVGAEDFADLLVLDRDVRRRFKGFDDTVDLFDAVVDDVEANAQGAEIAGDVKVCPGRFEMSAGMIVDDDVAGATGLEDGRDRFAVAAGEDFQIVDNLVNIGMADAEDFVAAAGEDLLAQFFL